MRPTALKKAVSTNARAASIILWLAAASPAGAQEDDAGFEPDDPLTADGLAAWVVHRNAGLDAAEAAAAAAEYRIEPAGALDDPMLSIGTAPRASTMNIDVSQRLPWPGTRGARRAVAQHESRAASWRAGAERITLASAAKSAFAESYYVARALDVSREVQALLTDLVATAQTRYAAGRAAQQDVLQAQVEQAELEARERQLLREEAAVLAHINGLLNRDPGAPLPPMAPVATEPPALDAEALERLALDRHPELKRLDAEIGAAGSRVALAGKAFLPDFQIRAGYNEMWSEADMRTTLGVSINVPLNKAKRRAELDRARAERRRAESTLSDERAQLLADVARAHAEVLAALETIEIHEEKLVPLAAAYLDAAIRDYQSGTGAFLNVITAEQRLLTTELALERTRADYLRRVAALERSTGGPLETAPAAREGEEQ